MLTGRITSRDDALLPIEIVGSRRMFHQVGVVDTGFNGALSLPHTLLRRAGWELFGRETFELANGKRISQKIYLGEVIFDGTRRRVLAASSGGGDILIGTRLLAGRRCEFDYVTRVVRLRLGGTLRG